MFESVHASGVVARQCRIEFDGWKYEWKLVRVIMHRVPAPATPHCILHLYNMLKQKP